MINYSHHRLENWDWVDKYIEIHGWEEYINFTNKVYNRLVNLQPGKKFDITEKVSEKNRDFFIKIACQFILEQLEMFKDGNYHFSDDYTKIIRMPCFMLHTSKTITPNKNNSIICAI